MPAKFPMNDHPIVVQIRSLLIYINFKLPSSVKVWNAILGLSLYLSSNSSNFFYLFDLCSKCGLSNVQGPSDYLTLIFFASSNSFYFTYSLSTSELFQLSLLLSLILIIKNIKSINNYNLINSHENIQQSKYYYQIVTKETTQRLV